MSLGVSLQAKILLGEAGRLLSLARQGVRDMRGSKPGPRPSSIVKEEAAEPGAPQQQGPPSQQGPEKRRGRCKSVFPDIALLVLLPFLVLPRAVSWC